MTHPHQLNAPTHGLQNGEQQIFPDPVSADGWRGGRSRDSSANLQRSFSTQRKGGLMTATATTSRTFIAALQVSLDGFVQGPEGEQDWVDSWSEALGLIPDVDLFVLGGRMYPDYGDYWKAILTNPEGVPPFQDRLPSNNEIAWARQAAQTPHVVMSTTLSGVAWPPTAQIVRNVADLRSIKAQPGKNTYVAGGATLVALLLNEGLIDELRLIVHPVVLGKGRGLFDGVTKRLSLDLVEAKSTGGGNVIVTYRTKRESAATRIVKSIVPELSVVEGA